MMERMEADPANEIAMPAGDIEDSETTVEIKIKTLDSQTYTLQVNKHVPVPALREQIATITGVLSEHQRLIYRGRVLKDDEVLSACHVEDGHTLHLVVREPSQSSSSPSSFTGSERTSVLLADSSPRSASNRGTRVSHTILMGYLDSVQGFNSIPDFSQVSSSILSSILARNAGNGNSRTDPNGQETDSERPNRASSDHGLSDSTQPQPISTSRVERDPWWGAFRFPSEVRLGSQSPTVIPDSLSSMFQYIDLLRNEFRRGGSQTDGGEHGNNPETAGLYGNNGMSLDIQSHPASGQGGVPNPTSLREVMLSTRQLLMEEAGDCLSEVSGQLGEQTSVSDPVMRMNIQLSAMRSGVLLQNLGALLLELGRTAMTLHMGQTPSEAVVNSGPAIFISPSGPNPLRVQPIPFHTGSSFDVDRGTVNFGHSLEDEVLDSAFLHRNLAVNIQISIMIPASSASPHEWAEAEQPHEHPQQQPTLESAIQRENLESNNEEPGRNGSHFDANSMPLDSGVSAPANESTRNQGFREIVVNSLRRHYAGSNDTGTRAYHWEQTGLLPDFLYHRLRTRFPGAEIYANRVNRQDLPMSSAANHTGTSEGAEMQDALRVNNDQEGTLPNILHQVMPVISQGRAVEPGGSTSNPSSTTAQTKRDTRTSSSSQQECDPPESPSSKRPRME